MRLVETKTYKINMAHTERIDLCKLADQLEEIANIFRYKEVYYTAIDDGECKIDIEEIDNVTEFLKALSGDMVRVY